MNLKELKPYVHCSDAKNGDTYVGKKRIIASRKLNTRENRKSLQNPPQKHNQVNRKQANMKRHKRDLIVCKLLAVGIHERQRARVTHGVLGLAVEENEIILIQLTDCE
jgi:hypothetical protein